MSKGADRMGQFERGVVFRVARGFFFLLAVAAVLLFAVGLGFAVRGALKTPVAAPPPLMPPAPPPPLTYADVVARSKLQAEADARLANDLGKPSSPTAGSASDSAAPARDPRREKMEALATELRSLFPEPPYAWQNIVESYCARPTDFGCLRRDVRIKTPGMVGKINAALEDLDDEETMHVVEVLVAVLEDAPVESRGELVMVVAGMEKERLQRDAQRRRAFAASEQEQRSAYAQEVLANEVRQAGWREQGIYGVAAGFGLLIVMSLFLAFLAMERHLRIMQRHLAEPPPS